MRSEFIVNINYNYERGQGMQQYYNMVLYTPGGALSGARATSWIPMPTGHSPLIASLLASPGAAWFAGGKHEFCFMLLPV